MRIRAAVLHEPGTPVAVKEVELAAPRAREVLVRVAAAGVCHSDVRLADGELGAGRRPIVLGHEGAGVVEAVGAVRNTAKVQSGETVCVIGCGGVGLQVIAAARLAGAKLIVAVDREPAKLELALRRGATHAVDASAGDAAAVVRKLSDGGVDHAFEVVGRAETIRLAWDVLRSGATAVVVGLATKGVEVSLPAIEFLSEKGIRGSYYGAADVAAELPELASLVADGRLDLGEVVSHVAGLGGVEEALERLRRGESVRTIITVDPALAGRTPE